MDGAVYLENNRYWHLPVPQTKKKEEIIKYNRIIYVQIHTEPFSDVATPDMLSARSLSLSGSMIALEDSDLFFRIDFDRRWVSTFGDVSIESCDRDTLSSVLAILEKKMV